MKLLANLFQHPASALVAVALVVLVIRLSLRFFQRNSPHRQRATYANVWSHALMCFFSGVLFTNALAHFSHGISGEQFPAPFGYALGDGFPAHLSNVLWGFLNLVLGYTLFVRGKVLDQERWRIVAFFAGVLAMGIFLSYVFS